MAALVGWAGAGEVHSLPCMAVVVSPCLLVAGGKRRRDQSPGGWENEKGSRAEVSKVSIMCFR